MFVQIKAIRKGVKPPIWRRACVPLGINFAKMAFILETLLELPVTDRYEFEFFREKDRLIERNNAETTRADYQFTYRDAVQSSVNERLMEKTWFTFRVKNGEDPPQYRVEVEKHADSGIVSDKTPYGCPMILREVSYKGELYWTSPEEINRKLIESCYLCEGEAEYPSFASIYERSMQGRGIIFSGKLESRENVIADSMQKVFAKVADSIMSVRAEPGKAAPGGTDAPDLVAPSSQNTAPVRKSGKAKSVTVDSMLNAYTREALMEIADECGCERVLSASRAADTAGKAAKKMTKPKMAYELARYLLEPGVMRRRLLELDEEELDAFEAVVQKGGRFYPSIEEEMLLDRVFSLCYLAEFSDDTVQVPEDAAAIYQVICSNGYRDYHRKARWLIDCIRAFALLYVVGNVELLYELYCRTDRFKPDRVEFDDILAKIPADRMECVKIGRRIVAKKAASNEFYKVIEQGQRDVPYYIPSAREILDYAGKGYPASDAAYKKLSDFFRYEFDLEEAECNNLCCRAFSIFASGRMLSDFMGVLDQRGVILRSQKQVERFARIAMEANNSTRMYGLKGHTPIEMHDFMEDAPIPARPKIKVYPNDPCPCGSGKKYKKCCGRGL